MGWLAPRCPSRADAVETRSCACPLGRASSGSATTWRSASNLLDIPIDADARAPARAPRLARAASGREWSSEPRASERGRSAQLHWAASAAVAAPRQPGCQEGRRIDAEEIEPASAEAHPPVLRASSWTKDATRWSRSARLAHHGVSMHVAPERSGRPDAASAVAPRTETLEFEVDHRGWRPSRAKLGTVGLARGDEARGGAWQGLRLA